MRDASINSNMHRCTKNCLAGRTIATQTGGFTSTIKREPQESYTARHLYLPDTHAALYADNWCSYGAISRPTQGCYELRWQCSFGGECLSTRRFERRGELYVILLNAMPFYYLGRGERNPHSLQQPRGDTYTREVL